ncbi:response regulator transcription factor [Alteromonas sp. ASW11-19]|uniref:Response regulator transcription factor n=1 Tax=Alteromonas salexigens TaxID=2982530 RepID=A0ABT2VPT0_9ALTE|nr:response regulator transcription factor [Alteromonas salexigens]MCU7555318.1 response regulator transcription factor [Alteromonas salexigens]
MQAKVLIADDHPLFRAAMKQALGDMVGKDIVEASSLSQTREQLAKDDDIELIFLDLNMPGNQGLTGLSELRTRFPNVLVVIVSAEEDPTVIRNAMALGSSGYIPKSTSLDVMADAVTQILEGEQWLPAGLDAALAGHGNAQHLQFAEKLALLTPHQFTVLKMMADGMLNKQIAYELAISESTVKQHVSAVLRKLDVINRTKAGMIFRQVMDSE